MSWKRRVKIGLGIVLAVLVAVGLWFARPMGLEEICPGLELAECRGIEIRYRTAERRGPYFDDTQAVLFPGEPEFDEVIGLLAEKKFSRSPFWWFPSGGKSHRWEDEDFFWYMHLLFEDVTLPDGSTGSGHMLQVNNFFGELTLRGYDGETYPVRTSGQKEWVREVLEIFLDIPLEIDFK